MAQAVSTAGMFLAYSVETTAGERPTEGYLVVPEMKDMPDFNAAPNAIDTTILLEQENMTYIDGLKDYGGALSYTVNLGDEIMAWWKKCLKAYDEAMENGMNMWWAVVHPKLKTANYFPGKPAPMGQSGASVNGSYVGTIYVMPTGSVEQEGRPTLAPETEQDALVRPYLKNMGLYPATVSRSKSNEVEV